MRDWHTPATNETLGAGIGTTIPIGDLSEDALEEEGLQGIEEGIHGVNLVDSMRDLGITHFVEVP